MQLSFNLDGDPHALSGRTDPDSSRKAATEMRDTGQLTKQRREVYDALVKHGPGTAREIAAAAGLDRYAVSRRCPELKTLGLAHQGPVRACCAGGRPSVEWSAITGATS